MEFSQYPFLFTIFSLSSSLIRTSNNNKVISVPLQQLGDITYYAVIKIGNSSEPLSILFDTVSQDLIIISRERQKNSNNTPFQLLPELCYAGESWTYSPFVEDRTYTDFINFHSEGHIGFVNISLGGISIKNQIYVNVTSNSEKFLQNTIFDGIIGIGPRNKTLEESNTVLFNMVKEGLISKPIVSFYLNRFSKQSQVIFGGVKPRVCKETLKHIPNIDSDQWMVNMDKIEIAGSGDFTFRKTNRLAIVSVRNHYILGPQEEIVQLNDAIGAIPVYRAKDYIINSRLLQFMPTINIVLNGMNFTLKPFDYLRDFEYLEKSVYETIFKPVEKGNKHWILGRTFIQKYFTQFNFETNTIGFAELR